MEKRIHQIYITDGQYPLPEYLHNKSNSLRELYQDYEYKLWGNVEIREFLTNHYDTEVLWAYDFLKPYAFKADLARYCILYTLGGYYYDVALCPELKFEPKDATIFKGITSELVTKNLDVLENNTLFFPQQQNDFLKQAISVCVMNAKNYNMGRHPIDVTGPMMLATLDYSTVTLGHVEEIDGQRISILDDEKICKHKHFNHQANLASLGAIGTNNYEKMWMDRDIYNFDPSQRVQDVIKLFRIVLGREPDPESLSYYVRRSNKSILEIREAMVTSSEYKERSRL